MNITKEEARLIVDIITGVEGVEDMIEDHFAPHFDTLSSGVLHAHDRTRLKEKIETWLKTGRDRFPRSG